MLFHDFLSTSVQRILQLVSLQLFTFLPSRACFEFEFLEELFFSWPILLVVELVLVEIQHNHDGCSPNPVVEHKLVAEVHWYNYWEIHSTLCSCFISTDLAWESKSSLFPSRRDFAKFAGLASIKTDSLLLKTLADCSLLKNRLVPILSDVRPLPQVSLCRWSSDFEIILTANLLFQSDKLAIVPHLLLAPANTVVKPAEHEFVRRPSLLLEV